MENINKEQQTSQSKISINDLYNIIINNMTPEEALKKLLASSLMQYEYLKFDKEQRPVHPIFIIAMAALDLGWKIAVPQIDGDNGVIGFTIGTDEYFEWLNKINKDNP